MKHVTGIRVTENGKKKINNEGKGTAQMNYERKNIQQKT